VSRRTLALAIASALAVVGLAWAALIVPAQHSADSSAAEIVQLRGELAAAARLPAKAAVPVFSPRLRAALRRAIPAQPMSGAVIGTLSRAARDAGVGLGSISLGAPSAAAEGGLMAIPVQLKVRGGYREIVDFVDRLDALVAREGHGIRAGGRLITIGGLAIGAGSTTGRAGDALTAQMQVSAYTTATEGSVP
jgi:Tfp pilus assembly protein PilO